LGVIVGAFNEFVIAQTPFLHVFKPLTARRKFLPSGAHGAIIPGKHKGGAA
jgi:hypothetical protein